MGVDAAEMTDAGPYCFESSNVDNTRAILRMLNRLPLSNSSASLKHSNCTSFCRYSVDTYRIISSPDVLFIRFVSYRDFFSTEVPNSYHCTMKSTPLFDIRFLSATSVPPKLRYDFYYPLLSQPTPPPNRL